MNRKSLLAGWLRSWGLQVAAAPSNSDEGDVIGWPGVTVTSESGVQWTPLRWLNRIDEEADNAGASVAFVAVKPKGKPACDDWVAVLRLPLLMVLLQEAGYLPAEPATSAVLDKALTAMRTQALVNRAEAKLATSFRGAPSDGRVTGWTTP